MNAQIGNIIKLARKKSKTTLNELADKTGLSVSYLSLMERGLNDPTLENLNKVCTALNLTLSDLIIMAENSAAVVVHPENRETLFSTDGYIYETAFNGTHNMNLIFMTTSGDMSEAGVSASYSANMISAEDIVRLLDIEGDIATMITGTISKIFDLVWSCGIQIVLFLAGLQSVPQSFFEASRVEGATKWEEFWFITFPMLSRVTLLVTVFTMVELITSERTTLIKSVYKMMQGGQYDTTSAMLWFYFLICGGIMAVIVFLYQRCLVRRWE